MLFTFKRNLEGHEFVMVETRIVWQCYSDMRMNTGWGRSLDSDVTPEMLGKAIRGAESMGFWIPQTTTSDKPYEEFWLHNEVAVDVTDNTVLTVETEGGDEA